MKQIFFLLAFLPFLAFAQPTQTTQQPPTPQATQVAPAQKPQFMYRDFDFGFYPDSQHRVYRSTMVVDSTRRVTAKIDTSQDEILASIEKRGSLFVINNIRDITNPFYKTEVKFTGLTNDNLRNLVYESKDQQTKQVIIVNPILGFVIVGFQKCENQKRGGDCDLEYHYFGRVPFKLYLP